MSAPNKILTKSAVPATRAKNENFEKMSFFGTKTLKNRENEVFWGENGKAVHLVSTWSS